MQAVNGAGDGIQSAMVLAAGFGTRMRPLTDALPKPLVKLAGRALIDHALDRLAEADIQRAVVNVHYLAEKITRHLEDRTRPEVHISDERGLLLETGGGVKNALGLLGAEPFFVVNSDSVWHENGVANLPAMRKAWAPEKMSALLLLADKSASLGFDGRGDFFLSPAEGQTGRLRRRGQAPSAPYVFAGVSILKPELFAGVDDAVFSLNRIFDIAAARGEFYGLVLDGVWMHVGTPAALRVAESYFSGRVGRGA